MRRKSNRTTSTPSSAVNLVAGAMKPVKVSGASPMVKPLTAKPGSAKRAAKVVANKAPIITEPNTAAMPSSASSLADLLDTINSLSCDVRRLAKAATRATVELGERLSELFDHASDGEWNTLVKRTAVNLADAASLVAFAEGRHGLIERLSPAQDVLLREVLNHLVALASALSLTETLAEVG
jgi:hypothetical protein